MKYLFDCTFIRPETQYKSIPTYAFRLLQALPDAVVGDCAALVRPSMAWMFEKLNPRLNIVVVRFNETIGKIPKIGSLYNYWHYLWCVKHLDFDSVLIFDELHRSNLFHTNKRKISVFHDLKVLKNPKRSRRAVKYYHRLIESCDSIIAISEYTKQDIMKYYHVDEQKIHVVYNSVCLPAESIKPSSFDVETNYILYVNTLQPYKNALTLVKAFNEIKDKYDLDIVFVGQSTDYWENDVMTYVQDNGLTKRVIRLQDLTNEELKYMYEHATLFVTTSLHEGFGYTPIEASICKCPVVSTMCEALQETTHNLLYYYEPAQDVGALKNRIIEVLDTPPSEKTLTRIAEYFSTLYNPQKQVLEVLRIMGYHL